MKHTKSINKTLAMLLTLACFSQVQASTANTNEVMNEHFFKTNFMAQSAEEYSENLANQFWSEHFMVTEHTHDEQTQKYFKEHFLKK